ncbi:MAG: hypothetical protein OEV42_17945, partial [Deltaproteobacteria bacterium]|nr:hypothetical protein [Deltaproteobacteria bacterium]
DTGNYKVALVGAFYDESSTPPWRIHVLNNMTTSFSADNSYTLTPQIGYFFDRDFDGIGGVTLPELQGSYQIAMWDDINSNGQIDLGAESVYWSNYQTNVWFGTWGGMLRIGRDTCDDTGYCTYDEDVITGGETISGPGFGYLDNECWFNTIACGSTVTQTKGAGAFYNISAYLVFGAGDERHFDGLESGGATYELKKTVLTNTSSLCNFEGNVITEQHFINYSTSPQLDDTTHLVVQADGVYVLDSTGCNFKIKVVPMKGHVGDTITNSVSGVGTFTYEVLPFANVTTFFGIVNTFGFKGTIDVGAGPGVETTRIAPHIGDVTQTSPSGDVENIRYYSAFGNTSGTPVGW